MGENTHSHDAVEASAWLSFDGVRRHADRWAASIDAVVQWLRGGAATSRDTTTARSLEANRPASDDVDKRTPRGADDETVAAAVAAAVGQHPAQSRPRRPLRSENADDETVAAAVATISTADTDTERRASETTDEETSDAEVAAAVAEL